MLQLFLKTSFATTRLTNLSAYKYIYFTTHRNTCFHL